jgi:hypothetical protein
MSIVNRNPSKSKRQKEMAITLDSELPQNDQPGRRILAFVCLVAGILASWFWPAAWAYLADPTQPFLAGTFHTLPVRLLLSLCIAALTFLPVYQKIYRLPSESYIIGLLAFQHGFFWQSAFYGVMQHFR